MQSNEHSNTCRSGSGRSGSSTDARNARRIVGDNCDVALAQIKAKDDEEREEEQDYGHK